MNAGCVDRLEPLARGGSAAARALWIETLCPEEALTELFGRRDDLSLLQKARFLLEMGRHGDAREVLGEVRTERPGLRLVRDELLSAVEGGAREESGGGEGDLALASATLAELHAKQGDVGAAIEIYRAVLARDPGDAEARSRLRALLAEGESPRERALDAWLTRVRGWRAHLRA